MRGGAATARAIRAAFGQYRRAVEAARDPDEGRLARSLAWTRAANARARIERQLLKLEAGA